MNTKILYIYNILRLFLPETSLFSLKNKILRLAGAKIGNNVRICSSVKILGDGDLEIGDNVWIGISTLIVSSKSRQNPNAKITIGSNIDIAPRVYIGTGTHIIDINSENIAGEGISYDIIIENGCWICADSTILPGVKVGSKTIVAAKALVNKDLLENSVYAGIPAKFIKHVK
ncbi:acyltransferase [Chryseobacterium gambrini]|uniref:Putative colanic acid biosynthesis acetyltransferase WcaF n=2 Tax=Chryseobacterium gambrini TaxID=373672 RepID=A0A1N7QPE3_9FLAO|nr:hypothetical protein [Chryseobacterium gambrini]WBV54212.1 acyltransferase [Chryseobacterium gambrini]SIT24367.1 putative colanic acid biosynthesis acetyltransferase WcaF [Chryseobacterium gambrini]